MKYLTTITVLLMFACEANAQQPHCNTSRRSTYSYSYWQRPNYGYNFIITDVGAQTRAIQAAKRRRAEQIGEQYHMQRIKTLREEKQYRRDQVHAFQASRTQIQRQLRSCVDMQEARRMLTEYVGTEPTIDHIEYCQDQWAIRFHVTIGGDKLRYEVSTATKTVVYI